MDSAASAWLLAFPTHPKSIMNNSAFEIAVRNRLLEDNHIKLKGRAVDILSHFVYTLE